MQATLLYLALILYPVINFLEAWLEVVVIDLKNPYISEYHKLNQREHLRSGVFACAVCAVFVVVALSLQLYWLVPAIVVNRRLVFDYGLKMLRGRPFDLYEGDGFFDALGRRVFGRENAEKEFAILLGITVFTILRTIV